MPASKRQEEEMKKRGWITVRAAAAKMHVSIGTIYRAIENGKLTPTMVGEQKYVSAESFRNHAGVITQPV